MAQIATRPDLYKARVGRVDFVEVPECGYVLVSGRGDPNGADFAAAVRALFTVSYGAHLRVGRSCPSTDSGGAPQVSAYLWQPFVATS